VALAEKKTGGLDILPARAKSAGLTKTKTSTAVPDRGGYFSTTNGTNGREWGSGFAGEFRFRSYS
jgi:hypothetical protein